MQKIAEATRDRVLKAIRELNYKPNKPARSLVVQRSDIITVIVPDRTEDRRLYSLRDQRSHAFGLIQRAMEKGVRIPDDLSIVGFDDISLSALINPPLTTVRHPKAEMGREAVNLLLEQLDQNEETSTESRLQNTLILRQSTKPLNTPDTGCVEKEQ